MVKNEKKFLLRTVVAKVVESKELLLAMQKWVCTKILHHAKNHTVLEVVGIKSDRCSANYWARRDWDC